MDWFGGGAGGYGVVVADRVLRGEECDSTGPGDAGRADIGDDSDEQRVLYAGQGDQQLCGAEVPIL